MGTCDGKKRVRFAVFPYVVEIPSRGVAYDDQEEEEGFFSGEEEDSEEEFVEPVRGNPVFLTCPLKRMESLSVLDTVLNSKFLLSSSLKLWFCNTCSHYQSYHYLWFADSWL
jgi:hypothetical protein